MTPHTMVTHRWAQFGHHNRVDTVETRERTMGHMTSVHGVREPPPS